MVTFDQEDAAEMPKENRKRLLRAIIATCHIFPVVLLLLIWAPEFGHYYVPGVALTEPMLESGRTLPPDPILEELRGFRFFEPRWSDRKQLIDAAEKLLGGRAEIPGYAALTIQIPFDPGDLTRGLPAWQLEFASLVVPEVLLDAYELTGREDFFRTARDSILGWASYERHARIPRGFLWNDHAVAERIPVLANFWRLYRHRKDYQPEVARAVWQLAARSGQMLAKPSHFTVRTNHGVMQNLALWHLCLAFPALPDVPRYQELALERMREQMAFYIDSEGVVLEHSASYHEFGLKLLGMAFRYLSLQGKPVPDDWIPKYANAQTFYAQLRRTDGSLPMYGDTSSLQNSAGPWLTELDSSGRAGPLRAARNWVPAESPVCWPLSGYAISWSGLARWPNPQDLSQTVMTWSYYPGHAHKHADEMSVLFWAAGHNWWTNVGYWPNGVEGQEESVGWGGANAPHLVGESAGSSRTAKLLSYAESPQLLAVQMERTGPGEYRARRQVLHIKPSLWIVLDDTVGIEGSFTTTTWTVAADIRVRPGDIPGSYILDAGDQGPRLLSTFNGSPGTTYELIRGRRSPFGGWQVVNGTPWEASAIVVEQPTHGSWALTTWTLSNPPIGVADLVGLPRLLEWRSYENWRMLLPLKSGSREILRQGSSLVVLDPRQNKKSISASLVLPPDIGQRKQLRDAYQLALRRYPRFIDLFPYRLRASYAVLLAAALQIAFFAALGHFLKEYHYAMRLLNVGAWVALGLWLSLSYLR